MHLKGLLCSAALLLSSTAAYADTFTTFDFKSSLGIYGTVDGTVVIDETTGVITNSNLVGNYYYFQFPNNTGELLPGTYTITGAPTAQGTDTRTGTYYADFGIIDPSDPNYRMVFLADSLIGFAGGPLCAANLNCVGLGGPDGSTTAPGSNGLNFEVQSGQLTPQAVPPPNVTPEPSSLVLLGTGFAGLFGVFRRRA